MASHLLLCITFFFFLLTSVSTSDDASIMLKLSTSIFPTPLNWKTDNFFCFWEGISCDKFNKVTSINLPSKSLTGTLPSDLNNLSHLKTLALQHNFLSGNLPTLANLTLLEDVYLYDNYFTSIPSDFFFGLTNLHSFSISDNMNLSQWSFPNHLTDSTSLHTFDAINACMIGSILDIFEHFHNLQNLRLSYNNLTGTLPSTFGKSQLFILWLNSQRQGLSGNLHVISSMIHLNQLWLNDNLFTGAIPDLSKCVNLFDLQLKDNYLTCVVPSSLMSLPRLVNLTLQSNRLQGPLPVFKNGVKVYLGLTTNSYCLVTPENCDQQVASLVDVTGAIGYPLSLAETWIGNDACQREWNFISCDHSRKNVTTIDLGKQKFSGTISPSFMNLTSLRILSLNDNNLTGSIPGVLTSLWYLKLLDVSNNNLVKTHGINSIIL